MRRDKTRVQLLALVLLGGLVLLLYDLEPVQSAVADYLAGMPEDEVGEDVAQAPPRQPTLEGRAPEPPADDTPTDGGGGATATDRARAVERLREIVGRYHDGRIHITVGGLPPPDRRPPIGNLADARRLLALSAEQLDELHRVLEDAQRDLDDLRYQRNDADECWHSIAADADAEGARAGVLRRLERARRLTAFARTELSGRGETYAEARRRLLGGYRDHVHRLLTPEQQHALEGHNVDPLFDATAVRTIAQVPHITTLTVRTLRKPAPDVWFAAEVAAAP